VCPEFPASPTLAHWSVPDPALEGQGNRASYPAFERTAAELEARNEHLLHTLAMPPTRRLQHANR
jgi:ArsR family transcriptional regulator, arsenate/arsenite/antimonite-responsive transcriptional repressor / arsenate reductase (thioredoxin)